MEPRGSWARHGWALYTLCSLSCCFLFCTMHSVCNWIWLCTSDRIMMFSIFPPGEMCQQDFRSSFTIMKQPWKCGCPRSLLSKKCHVFQTWYTYEWTSDVQFKSVYLLDYVPTGKPAISLKWKALWSSKDIAFLLEEPVLCNVICTKSGSANSPRQMPSAPESWDFPYEVSAWLGQVLRQT